MEYNYDAGIRLLNLCQVHVVYMKCWVGIVGK